jgi:renalase
LASFFDGTAMSASEKPQVAIIGTGLSGLACADGLAQDFELSLFDKSRGLSGRLSTRRAQAHAFDHGAQYFRAESAAFQNWLQPFEAAGHVQRWTPRHVNFAADGTQSAREDAQPKLVFAPGMSAIGKALVAGRPQWKLYLDCGVEGVEGQAGDWVLRVGEQRFGPFAHIVFAMPPAQIQALLPVDTSFSAGLAKTQMVGCHTLMLGFGADEALQLDWECAHFDDDVLGFAAVNSSKPGRGGELALVLQTKHDWSQAHIEDGPEAVGATMKARFEALTGGKISASGYDRVHRWRYASTRQASATPEQPYLRDAAQGLSAVGDWCSGSKVEHAFLSGAALAASLSA